jgi:hypothetical protein
MPATLSDLADVREYPPSDEERAAKRMRLCKPARLEDTGTDCLGIVVSFLDTFDWIQFSYTCRAANSLKYVKHLMIHKKRSFLQQPESLEKALQSLTAAKGTLFNADFSRAPMLDYMTLRQIDDRFLAPLAGTIHTLNLTRCNLVTDRAYVHLTGLHALDISHCDQLTVATARNIPGLCVLDFTDRANRRRQLTVCNKTNTCSQQ